MFSVTQVHIHTLKAICEPVPIVNQILIKHLKDSNTLYLGDKREEFSEMLCKSNKIEQRPAIS